jgi:hypothetical protein
MGVAAVMDKPFDMSDLLEKVRTVIAGRDPHGAGHARPQ